MQEIGDCVLLLDEHTGPLTDMAVSADGAVLATASEDGTARVWDMVSLFNPSSASPCLWPS